MFGLKLAPMPDTSGAVGDGAEAGAEVGAGVICVVTLSMVLPASMTALMEPLSLKRWLGSGMRSSENTGAEAGRALVADRLGALDVGAAEVPRVLLALDRFLAMTLCGPLLLLLLTAPKVVGAKPESIWP